MLTLILGTVIFVEIYYFVGKEKDPMKESLKQAKNKRLEIIDEVRNPKSIQPNGYTNGNMGPGFYVNGIYIGD